MAKTPENGKGQVLPEDLTDDALQASVYALAEIHGMALVVDRYGETRPARQAMKIRVGEKLALCGNGSFAKVCLGRIEIDRAGLAHNQAVGVFIFSQIGLYVRLVPVVVI